MGTFTSYPHKTTIMKTEKVYIEKVVYGGFGLGRLNSGQIILVANALPEETAIVTVQQEKKNHLFGRIVKITDSHPLRISPPCPYKQCGGCNLHHTTYENQLAIKEAMLTDLLQHQTNKSFASDIMARRAPILPSTREYGYRQRIRLQLDKENAGYRGRNSHSFVKIEKCMLAQESINSTLAYICSEQKGRELLARSQEIESLHNPADNTVVALLHFPRPPRPEEKKKAVTLVEKSSLLRRIFFIGKNFALEGPYPQHPEGKCLSYHYEIAGKQLQFGFEVGGFCQVNLEQNEQMIRCVRTMANVQKGEKILDLYCGMGNFALPLALDGAEVFGIEGQGGAIRSAKENARNAFLSAVFKKSPVEDACRKLAEENSSFDTVVIDPPRRGIPQMAEIIARLTKKKLIYISCDPATLMRDLFSLHQAGFSVTAFQPVDMFPQTHHIESIVLLEKSH